MLLGAGGETVKSKQHKKEKELTPMDKYKLEIAEEIGLLDKIKEVGWAGLKAHEAGYLGGVMSRRMRQQGIRKGSDMVSSEKLQ